MSDFKPFGSDESNKANPYQSTATTESPVANAWKQNQIPSDIKAKLNASRGAMVILGLITMGVNIFLFVNAPKEVADVVAQDRSIDEATLLVFVRAIYGVMGAIGVAMIGLGMVVMRFPIFATLTGLLLYGGSAAVGMLLDPANIARGIIIKIIVIVILFQGVSAAFKLRSHNKDRF